VAQNEHIGQSMFALASIHENPNAFDQISQHKSKQLAMGFEPADLARWIRFAAKGGIGKCKALCDCVAKSPDDLMFLKVCS